MNLSQRPVVIHGIEIDGIPRHTRTFKRAVYNAAPTYHTTTTWVGTPLYQWKGIAKILGTWYDVWGYSCYPDTPPEEFSNDTY